MSERRQKNVLKIGINTLEELDLKVKAFRYINPVSRQKRFILASEDIIDEDGNQIAAKGDELDAAKIMLMRRYFKPTKSFKTYQPDVGIVLVSEMKGGDGVQLTMDLVTNVMNIGRGIYQSLIERIDSFAELNNLLKVKKLFPRLIIIGYIPNEKLNEEHQIFQIIQKNEPYIRMMEVLHSPAKQKPLFPKLINTTIIPNDKAALTKFYITIIQEYTKDYSIE
jgi:hypothetical protein